MHPHFEELDRLSVEVDDVIYMPSLDHPEDRPHPFVYFIKICNQSPERVSIQGRKWVIRENDSEEVLVVEGDGVVGQTPDLGPGEEFSYNSYHVTRSSGYAEGAFSGQPRADELFSFGFRGSILVFRSGPDAAGSCNMCH